MRPRVVVSVTRQVDLPAWTEADRLAALERYGILDTPNEPAFDNVVQLLTELLDVPIAAVNLIASARQWFKAEVGLGVREMPLDDSICAKVMLQSGGLVVPDLMLDARFDCNPLVTGAPHLRFYAGELLETPDGLPLGTLCVLDTRPRPEGLSVRHQFILRTLAQQVTSQLELRRAVTERDVALADRRTAEALTRQIVDGVTDYAIVSMDLQGRITSWNSGAQRNLGWAADEVLGRSVELIFTPEDRAAGRMQSEMRSALEVGRGTDERWHVEKGGRRFWATGTMMPLKSDAGIPTGFVKVLRDRTEERGRQQRLAVLAEVSAGLLETSDPDAVLGPLLAKHADLLGFEQSYSYVLGPDGASLHLAHAIGASDEIRAALDQAPSSLLLCGIVAETRRPLIVSNLQATTEPRFEMGRACGLDAFVGLPLLTGNRLHGVISFGTSSRAAFDEETVAFFATLARYAAGVRERVENEAALRGSEATLRESEATLRELASTLEERIELRAAQLMRSEALRRAYFDHSPDYVVLTALTDDGRVVYADVNPAMERRFKFKRADVIGREPREVIDAASAASVAERTRECLRTGALITYEYEREMLGTVSVVSVVGVPVEAPDEGRRLVLFCGSDITEQRRAEEALRQSQKMEAVGQLTGGIAHDFNNLLTGISGSLELLQTRVAQGRMEGVERYVTAAQGAAKRAAALTHRLLAFSRRQTLDPKPTDVNRLIGGMVELVGRTVGPEIAVETVMSAELWTTLIDPGQLESALLNLCINARDAMPGGGRLVIGTGNADLDEAAGRERELPAGRYVSLYVSDNGSGMTAEVVARAFDPFFTTKPIGQGTGLGLSMIYGFVRQSGGQARIESEVGRGTTVRLYLPRHDGVADELEATGLVAEAPRAGRGETVLVVDDEPTVRMLIAEVLEELGYTSIEVSDGAAGLDVLRSEARIDLLVTDVGLPGGMNGRQVADAGRTLRPGLKVLFITGYAEKAVLGQGHLEDGMHVLTKPFAMDALGRRIQELIAGQ